MGRDEEICYALGSSCDSNNTASNSACKARRHQLQGLTVCERTQRRGKGLAVHRSGKARLVQLVDGGKRSAIILSTGRLETEKPFPDGAAGTIRIGVGPVGIFGLGMLHQPQPPLSQEHP